MGSLIKEINYLLIDVQLNNEAIWPIEQLKTTVFQQEKKVSRNV